MLIETMLLWFIFLLISSFCEADDVCYSEEKTCCIDLTNFGPKNASIFVIEAKGRLGNHLIAYTLIQALAKNLHIQPFITEETFDFLNNIFQMDPTKVPVLERTFCNVQELGFNHFDGSLEELLSNNVYHRGKVLDLWPWGYKVDQKTCCPAMELIEYVEKEYLEDFKKELDFRKDLETHSSSVKQQIAEEHNIPIGHITFVGIHNRRTVKSCSDLSPKAKTLF